MDGILSSSAFMTNAMVRQGASLRAALQSASTELTTGTQADTGRAVGGDFSALAAIDHSLGRLRGYTATTTEAGLLAGAMQTALGVVSDAASELSTNLLRNVGLGVEDELSVIVADGRRHFDTALASLNTRLADRAVFGGIAADTPPLPDSETFLIALETATASALTAADVETAVTTWFNDPAGYAALYAGGAGRDPLPVAPGETADLAITALDPAFKETLAGLATAALLDRGILSGQADERANLARSAGEKLLSSSGNLANLAARIGTTEAQVASAKTRNAAETTALGLARIGLIEADPYEAAARLQDLQTRLESLYVITARLSGLTLTEYLR